MSATATSENLFLPFRYSTNPPHSADADGTPFWQTTVKPMSVRYQEPVYRYAARLVRRRTLTRVVDVGCGTGHKLVKRVGRVTDDFFGVDQGSGIEIASQLFPSANWIAADFRSPELWLQLRELHPSLVICSDVIEHVDDPVALLGNLRSLLGRDGLALISTPDRARLPGASPVGPPVNLRHIREWSAGEFELLLEAAGLEVVGRRHLLPRSYGLRVAELAWMAWKLLRLRAVPDRRYNMAFLVRPRA